VTAKRLEGRIALVTGASRGIGAAVARRFAEEGAQLILVARTTGGLEELDDDIRKISGHSATLVPMDLTDYDKIDQMGALLYERFGHLDVLVGNAGMLGVLSPLGHTDPKVWERTMAVNLTANWRLIRAMDPLLQRSEAGRAIFVTSSVGAAPRAYWSTYAVSKAGLEMLARTYAAENAKSKVNVNLINPGGTRTAMRAQAMPGEDPESVKQPEAVTDAFVDLAEASCQANGAIVDCR
jgi:NAD(P)-dependent dehydrogenase (short-subunit alcohol dehydrogenase family)